MYVFLFDLKRKLLYICYLIKINIKFKKMKNQQKIPTEQAIKEVRAFVGFHDELAIKPTTTDDEVEEKYPNIVDAITRGNLIFSDKQVPTLTLAYPIKGEESEITTINFKTRIKPVDNANITKGMDVSKNSGKYVLKCLAYLTMEPEGVINALEKYDYKTVEQICTVFF